MEAIKCKCLLVVIVIVIKIICIIRCTGIIINNVVGIVIIIVIMIRTMRHHIVMCQKLLIGKRSASLTFGKFALFTNNLSSQLFNALCGEVHCIWADQHVFVGEGEEGDLEFGEVVG